MRSAYARSDFDSALRTLPTALADARGAGTTEDAVRALRLGAMAMSDQGRVREALDMALDAFDLARALRLRLQMVGCMGGVATELGRLDQRDAAERILLQALSRAREWVGEEDLLRASTINSLVRLLTERCIQERDEGRDRDAIATLGRLLPLAHAAARMVGAHDGLRRVMLRNNAWEARALAGEGEEALRQLARSEDEARSLGATQLVLRTQHHRIEALLHMGRADDAAALAHALLDHPDTLAQPVALHELLHTALRAARLRGRTDEADTLRARIAALEQTGQLPPPPSMEQGEALAASMERAVRAAESDWAPLDDSGPGSPSTALLAVIERHWAERLR